MTLSRRELLASLLGVPICSQLLLGCEESPTAPSVEGDLLGPSMELGHLLRQATPALGEWDRAPTRRVPVAILGGGPAGLVAGWRLLRRGIADFAVIEMEPRAGGTSVSGTSRVSAYPWGAHYLPVPMPHQTDLIALLREMGALVGTDARGLPVGAEEILIREPEERLFHHGLWYAGLYPFAGASAEDLEQFGRFRAHIDRFVGTRDGRGRRAFSIPLDSSSDDPVLMELDRISARDFMDREGLTSERLRWFVEYACRDDYGLTLGTTSAWAALWYYAARTFEPGEPTMDLLAWPEGNGALVRHLTSTLGDRVTTGRMVVDVAPSDEGVRIALLSARDRRPELLIADRAILALPRFITRRVLRPLRESGNDEGFRYGAWMVANLHLDGRPTSHGYEPAWDNVLYDSPSLGYVTATHQRGRDFGPTVLTYYLPITDDDERAGRQRLYEATWQEWKETVVRDLSRAHPDIEQHLRRLDVWRWGHAMIQPRVGFLSSTARRRAREPMGRVHFAHSDLSGVAIFEEAFHQGLRAADEVLAAVASLESVTLEDEPPTQGASGIEEDPGGSAPPRSETGT